jgi:septal ring factor EnvC (AmiA/AmiB activator)
MKNNMNKDEQIQVIELKVSIEYMTKEILELKTMIKEMSLTNNSFRADINALSSQYSGIRVDIITLKDDLAKLKAENEDTKLFKQTLRISGNLIKVLIGSNVLAFAVSIMTLAKLILG